MCKRIMAVILSILLIMGGTIGVSAENIEEIPFTVGQNLSGTIANEGTVYYQFSLGKKETVKLDSVLTGGTIRLEIKDYNDKTYFESDNWDFNYNSITNQYTGSFSNTLEKGTYLLIVKGWYLESVTYSIKTSAYDAGIVSGTPDTPGNMTIGLRLKRKKSIQLTPFLSGLSGKTTWRSSKRSVAKVTSKGKVTARKKGTATITAKCNGKTAKIKIRVY